VKILVAPMCTEFKDRRSGREQLALGHEAAGVVVDAGGSGKVREGDRVAVMPHYGCGRCWLCTAGDYMYCPNQRDVLAETGQEYGTGTYAQYVLKPDWLLAPIPDDIPLEHGAMACCGLGPSFGAAERMHLDALDTLVVSGCGPVGLGALVHGAVRGARTLANETQPYRAELARRLGADTVIDSRSEDLASALREANEDRHVDVILEMVGGSAFEQSLSALAHFGRLVHYGQSAREGAPPVNPGKLMATSRGVIGFWLMHLVRAPERLGEALADMFDAVVAGELEPVVGGTYPLAEARRAHEEIRSRETVGKLVLEP
jgi:threonine dehydrogenase-like Zn-dependent dehydrogenase